MNLYCTFFTSTVPHVEFSIQFQSNSLIYDKGYSIRQHMIYSLIQLMKEEGLGYRRISKKLNQWEIKKLIEDVVGLIHLFHQISELLYCL